MAMGMTGVAVMMHDLTPTMVTLPIITAHRAQTSVNLPGNNRFVTVYSDLSPVQARGAMLMISRSNIPGRHPFTEDISMNKKIIGSMTLGSMVALASTGIQAADAPFSAQKLDSGYQLAAAEKDAEGKCGEGKCGEGACGAKSEDDKNDRRPAKDAKKDENAKDAEGKCGEGKCGEGACGAAS